MGPANEVGPDQIARLTEVMEWVRNFAKSGFVAQTESMTLADVCFVATYSTLEVTALLDAEKVTYKIIFYKSSRLAKKGSQFPHP